MVAFALAAAAARTGDPVLVEEVGMALRDAVFERGLDVGRPEVVAPIAARFDLEPLDAAATSRPFSPTGTRAAPAGDRLPHFFTPEGESRFCPVLDISRDDVGNFVIAWKQGTEAFVDSLLG